MKPIFIFSLPRSGSTLLQRMLCTSEKVSSASETWILLPYLYVLKPDGVISEYGHHHSIRAINDFYRGFPNQKDDYDEELRNFVLKLYEKRMEEGADYFLDKTPRYHLICREIMELFPEGKFIFLWRNPLSVVSSILNTWTRNKWKLSFFKIDLFDGLSNLIDTYKASGHISHAVNYESLLQNPAHELTKICDYLEIDYSDAMSSSFANVHLDGFMGDRAGIRKYKELNLDSLGKWQHTFDNMYRRIWARRYLRWIGDENLSLMGYNRHVLEKELKTSGRAKYRSVIQDTMRQLYCNALGFLFPIMKTRKNRKWYFYD